MVYSPAFTFSSGYPLGVLPFAGLRLRALRQFQVFFASTAQPPWRSAFSRFVLVVKLGFPVLASGSNCAVKPTRLRRVAYFRSLACEKSAILKPMLYSLAFTFSSVYLLVFCVVPDCAFWCCATFKSFWPPAPVQQALPAIIFAALRRFLGAVLFLGPRPSSRLGAPFWPSGLTVRRSRPPTASAELRALAPPKTNLFSPCLFKRHSISQALCSAGFAVSPGFACWHCVVFQPFWLLALA